MSLNGLNLFVWISLDQRKIKTTGFTTEVIEATGSSFETGKYMVSIFLFNAPG